MAAPKKTLWEIEAHTKAKHLILQRYMQAWLPIISRRNGRVVFIDGFAGPGVYAGGEDGSPIIAMRALIDHAHKQAIQSEVHFVFFEADKKRSEHLSAIIDPICKDLPKGCSVSVSHGEYAKLLSDALDELEANGKQLAPSLVFVDPFGVSGLPMDLVRRVLATPSCEVLVNFMTGYAHRFISAPEFEKHLDEIFGTSDWRNGRALTGHARIDFLRKLYISELQRQDVTGGARYARAFSMLNAAGQPIYDLVFATNHPVGIDRMKDALWKVDANAGERFSDATDPDQPTLLDQGAGHDDGLIAMLRETFRGTTVSWSVVEERIRQSPYRILKMPLLRAAKDPDSGISISPRGRGIKEDALLSFS